MRSITTGTRRHEYELSEYRQTLKPLRELYGHTAAAASGPLALEVVRQRMIDAGLCRKVINKQVSRIRSAFKWATRKQMIPPIVLEELRALEAQQRGRTAAKESPKLKPVPDAFVGAIRPHVLPRSGPWWSCNDSRA
jgi:hypothetical protein